MALKIIQICDGCETERTIRNVDDTETFHWVSFWDDRMHLCGDCIDGALAERNRRNG